MRGGSLVTNDVDEPSAVGRESRRGRVRRRSTDRFSGTLWLLGTAGFCSVLLLPGVRDGINNLAVTPLPGFLPGAVDGLVAIVNGMRDVSLFVAAAAVVAVLVYALAGRRSAQARTLSRLARIEYAGVDHVEHGRPSRWKLATAVRRFVAGTGLATLAVLLVGATSGVEKEVTNGPLRPIEALTDLVSGSEVSFVFQGPGITFMDDSSIPTSDMDRLVATAPFGVVPFGKHLLNLNDKSALQISVPDEIYKGMTGQFEAGSCADRTIVVDDTVGAATGDTVTLNGVRLRVVGVEPGIAQMNRSIAILADATMRECVQQGTSAAYFGAMVTTRDVGAVEDALQAAGIGNAAAGSHEDFAEKNRDFWRANATPVLLQLILYLALFSAFAAAGERQSTLQRNSREIGMLNASGVDFRALRAVERRRALTITIKATLLAAPLMVPVAAAFNASELGMQISVGVTEVAVGLSLTLASMLLASRRSLNQFQRSLDLPLAVKG